jgi:Ca2+-dependent lipid-binding protein
MYSQVVNESLNPVWNQTFDFVVEDGLHDMLIIELWDHDTFGKVIYFKFVCLKLFVSKCVLFS